jgi:hypothetical protein
VKGRNAWLLRNLWKPNLASHICLSKNVFDNKKFQIHVIMINIWYCSLLLHISSVHSINIVINNGRDLKERVGWNGSNSLYLKVLFELKIGISWYWWGQLFEPKSKIYENQIWHHVFWVLNCGWQYIWHYSILIRMFGIINNYGHSEKYRFKGNDWVKWQ